MTQEQKVNYRESVAPEQDFGNALIDVVVNGAPYVLLTLEAIDENDGLTAEEIEQTDGVKIVARVGNGVKDKETARVFLTRALRSIPE